MTTRELDRARAFARLLDSALRIPGTSITVGLDSLIGLVPGVGDLAGAALSGYIILIAVRLGASPAVLVRMFWNIGLDTVVGTIPLVGDVFDVAFRSNIRNVALLDRHLSDPAALRRSSRVVVMAAIAGVVALVAGGIALAMLAAKGLNLLVK